MRVGSVLGLGLAYANSKRETVVKNEDGGVIHELKKVLTDNKPSATAEVKGLTGLSLGLIMVGTGDHTVAMEMLQTLMERNETELADPNMRFLALGIALIFLGLFNFSFTSDHQNMVKNTASSSFGEKSLSNTPKP